MTAFASLPFSMAEAWAQAAIERVLHSLPEGLLVALFAWAVLRVLPKQNSRTRFVVWFVALMAVVGMAFLGGHPISSELSAGPFSSRVSELHLPAHWAVYLLMSWIAIASMAMARLAAGLWHLRALRQSCTPVNRDQLDPAIAATMDELNAAHSFGSRRVVLATSERVRVPSALGLWAPVIALPPWAAAELSPAELSIVLRHEFAHLRRWDDWTNLVQKVVCALFFFHPAVWWIESRLSIEREMACDDVVVAETDNPMGYANCLVSLLERSLAQRGWTMAQAIVHRAREASQRVAQILDTNRPVGLRISKPALGLVGTFAVLCVVMLPATPQFVTFDRGMEPGVEPGYSAALAHGARVLSANDRSPMRAMVVPAGLKNAVENARALSGSPTSLPVQVRQNAPVIVRSRPALNVAARKADPSPLAGTVFTSTAPASEIAQAGIPEVNAHHRNAQDGTAQVFFVRETQFVTAEIPVPELTIVSLPRGPIVIWTVRMMRVTMLAPVWREMQMPPAKKI